ncbi:MAG: CoA-binding protein [Ignavibacteria bacterium]
MTLIEEMLKNTGSIAVIGAKDKEWETAYKVPFYMYKHGFRIFPVNPKLAGKELFGEAAVEKVNHLIDIIDMVNIFRKPDFLDGHALEILQMNPLPKYVWFQLGIYNDTAARILEEKGIKVVQNRCIMVEHANME